MRFDAVATYRDILCSSVSFGACDRSQLARLLQAEAQPFLQASTRARRHSGTQQQQFPLSAPGSGDVGGKTAIVRFHDT